VISWKDVLIDKCVDIRYFKGILVGYFRALFSHLSEETEEIHTYNLSQNIG
jgi:hypothetical protein